MTINLSRFSSVNVIKQGGACAAAHYCELTLSQHGVNIDTSQLHQIAVNDEVDPYDNAASQRSEKRISPPANGRAESQSLPKANEAIAIRPKRGRLTLLSRRIYNVLLYHAQQQGVEQPTYAILMSELIDDARFNSNNTELLKSHIRDMQATTIEWYTSGAAARRWTSTQLLGPVVIDEPGRGQACTITWTYPEPIRERLLRPGQYTKILLEISSHMRSYAAAVLYELGARYLTSPGRLTMREDVLWWAAVLTGRSDITQVDYRILHRDTIKKALVELDTLCEEFRMELVEHRRGRKVEEFQFRVVPKPQAMLSGLRDDSSNRFDLELVDRVVSLGFKRPDAQDLYATTDEGVLRGAVEHVEQRMKNSALPPLGSPAAFLRDALKKRYVKPINASQDNAVAPPERVASVDEKLQRLREEWIHQRSMDAKAAWQEDTLEEEKGEYLERFDAEVLDGLAPPIAKAWRRDGVKSRIAASTFYRWLATQMWREPVTDKMLLEFALGRK